MSYVKAGWVIIDAHFTGEFELPDKKLNEIRDVCLFLVFNYLEPWYSATDPVVAPRTDLKLLQNILEYAEISEQISSVALSVFKQHLWYLNDDVVALVLFDPDLDVDVKREIVSRLYCPPRKPPKTKHPRILRYTAPPNFDWSQFKNVNVSHFVSSSTMKFFSITGLDTDFLETDPATWENNEIYKKNLKIVKGFYVVNDTAERGVALTKNFNRKVSRDEEDFQNLLLVRFHVNSPCDRFAP